MMSDTLTNGTPNRRPVPKTAKQFRAAAERMFRTANSDVAALATIDWEFVSRPHRGKGDPTMLFRNGYFMAAAPGYRTQRIMCTLNITTGRMSVG